MLEDFSGFVSAVSVCVLRFVWVSGCEVASVFANLACATMLFSVRFECCLSKLWAFESLCA